MDQEINLTLKTRHLILGVFALGLVVGLSGGLVASQFSSSAATESTDSANPSQPSDTGNQKPSDSGVSVKDISLKGEPVMGENNAPVTIVYWGDYQCPFCKRFEQQTLPRIKKNYIDRGKVRFVFKDFAFLGPDSTAGSIASECVWKQVGESNPEAYWNWHASMFDNQDGENKGWGSKKDIINMTEKVEGVDAQKLRSCMENNKTEIKQEISQDQREGKSVGITGTPGFVIYKTGSNSGQKIVGAQPYRKFRSVIEQVRG